jgi:adenylosuccinate lyase
VQLVQATDLLLKDLDETLAALKARAFEHKHTLTIGRSHGIHAEPTSFGLKLAGHYAEFARNRTSALKPHAPKSPPAPFPARWAPTPISTRAWKPTWPNAWACRPRAVSTQVIPRDRHAAFFCALGRYRQRH